MKQLGWLYIAEETVEADPIKEALKLIGFELLRITYMEKKHCYAFLGQSPRFLPVTSEDEARDYELQIVCHFETEQVMSVKVLLDNRDDESGPEQDAQPCSLH